MSVFDSLNSIYPSCNICLSVPVTGPSGINPLINEQSDQIILTYPNPFKNEITINYQSFKNEPTMQIFDLLGSKIDEIKLPTSGYEIGKITWHTDIPKGIYFLQLVSGQDISITRIIKE